MLFDQFCCHNNCNDNPEEIFLKLDFWSHTKKYFSSETFKYKSIKLLLGKWNGKRSSRRKEKKKKKNDSQLLRIYVFFNG